MRSLRSTRSTALRLTAAAASGVVAVTVLTGCLGKKDKDKAAVTGSSSAPTSAGTPGAADPSASSAPSGSSSSSSGSSGSGSGSGSNKPTSAATSDKVNKLDLKIGDCVDFDADDKMTKASCTGEHDAETVAVYAMPSSMTPTSMTYRDDVKAKCMEFIKPVVDRQADPKKYTGTWIFPDSAAWMNNDRSLQCLVMHRDQTPMPAGKLK